MENLEQKSEDKSEEKLFRNSDTIRTEIYELIPSIGDGLNKEGKDRLGDLYKAIRDEKMTAVDMEPRSYLKPIVKFFAYCGLDLRKYYFGKSKKELEEAISKFDTKIYKIDSKRKTLATEIDNLKDTRDKAIEVRHKSKEGIESATYELEDMKARYSQGGENKSTRQEIREKQDSLRFFTNNLNRYAVAAKGYQFRIAKLQNSLEKHDTYLQLAELMRLGAVEILMESVPAIDIKEIEIELAELGLNAEKAKVNHNKNTIIYEAGNHTSELSILNGLVSGNNAQIQQTNTDYQNRLPGVERKVVSEQVNKRTDALNQEMDSLEDKIKLDPMY